jgi:hypothetical protein
MASYQLPAEAMEELIRNVQLLCGVDRLSARSIIVSGLTGTPCEMNALQEEPAKAFIETFRELVRDGNFEIEI